MATYEKSEFKQEFNALLDVLEESRYQQGFLSLEELEVHHDFLKTYNKSKEAQWLGLYMDHLSNEPVDIQLLENVMDAVGNHRFQLLTAHLLYETHIQEGDYEQAASVVYNVLMQPRRRGFWNYRQSYEKFIESLKSPSSDVIRVFEILIEQMHLPDELQIVVLKQLGSYYLEERDRINALDTFIKITLLADELGLPEVRAQALLDVAAVFKQIGSLETVIAIGEYVLDIQIEDPFQAVEVRNRSLLELTKAYLMLQKYDMALNSMALIKPYDVALGHAQAHRKLTEVLEAYSLINQGRNREAQQLLEACLLAPETSSGVFSYQAICAQLYMKLGVPEEARALYEQLLQHPNIQCNDHLYTTVLSLLVELEDDVAKKAWHLEELVRVKGIQQDTRRRNYTYHVFNNVINKNPRQNHTQGNSSAYPLLVSFLLFLGLGLSMIGMKIKRLLTRDTLVNSYNRKHFDRVYQNYLDNKQDFFLLFFDLDNFKSLNDTFGHQFGDFVLTRVCERINLIIKQDAKLFRYGGEEFAILIRGKSSEEVQAMAEDIRCSIQSLEWEVDVNITLSIGGAQYVNDKEDVFKKADQNLYISKKTGKNKVTF